MNYCATASATDLYNSLSEPREVFELSVNGEKITSIDDFQTVEGTNARRYMEERYEYLAKLHTRKEKALKEVNLERVYLWGDTELERETIKTNC